MTASGIGNWSVSFGSSDLSFGAPSPPPADEALLAASGRAVMVSEQQYLWFDDQGNAPTPVHPDEALLLGHCSAFARLDEHVSQLSRQLGAPAAAITPLLSGLHQRRLLRPLKDFLPQRVDRRPAAPAPTQVVRTCRRPDGLKRLLASLLDEQNRSGGLTGPLYVVDDSADPASEAQSRAILNDYAAQSGRPTGLLDGAGRERLLAPWRGRLAPNDQMPFDALLSPERAPAAVPGRAFNWALLLGAGQVLSILDDDFCLPLKQFATARGDLEIRNSTAYLAEFPDPDDVPTLVNRNDPIYAEGLRLLGQPAAAVLADWPLDAEGLAGSPASELAWLDPHRRIRAVIQGTYGSFGVASVLPVCGPGRRTLANLLRTPFRMDRLMADPIHYGVERIRLADQAVSLPWLIDARDLVPPTNAAGVAEDTLFATLLRQLDPTACFAYVPSLIGHHQAQRRDRIRDSLLPIAFDANHFLAQQLQSAARLPGSDATTRMQFLAEWCADWLRLDDTTLIRLATRWWNEERANACARLTEALALAPQAPAAWRDFVRQMHGANQRIEPALPPKELATLRQAIAQTRLALAVWPELYASFKGLPAEGRLDLIGH